MNGLPSCVPVGGTTGLDHEYTDIDDAARWLAVNGPGQAAVNEVRVRFGLAARQLGEVCAEAGRIRREARS